MSLNPAVSKTRADVAIASSDSPGRQHTERQFDPELIKALNEKYRPLGIEERIGQLYHDFDAGKVMLTSSFAATSAFLLHLFSRFAPEQRVFFIDTGYHFPQTLEYKRKLTELYKLKVVDVRA